MTTAVLSLLGVVAGAFLQYFFSRHLDSLRTHRDARTKAYADYLRCVSEHAHPNQMVSSDGHALAARTADAKCRICLYGASEVVAAFAQFERLGAATKTQEQRGSFTRMVAAMRDDSARSANLATADLNTVLFGTDR